VTRRLLAAALALSTAVVLDAALLTSPSSAADKEDLNVVGTSDVSDSKLIDFLKPKFEAAYPQYNLLYSGNATLKAIDLSKSGNYDALIVHAASVENQYVDEGWSAEPYGRAIFWGDFVLLGPESDPAGVLDSSSHDVVSAFEKIAKAGDEGKAHFISRSGAPGTTVQEHAIWEMTDDSAVAKCTVSNALGGGETPSTDPSGTACPSATSYPDWYDSGDRKQAANIQYADQCTDKFGSEPDCYVLTDRGTYQYLASTGALSTLQIVTRDNDDTARGGIPALVNSFHAYAVNPQRFDDPDVRAGINLTGATDFLNWLTSSAGQAAVGSYLNDTNDAPFLPSAAPTIAIDKAPKQVAAGKKLTVTGSVTNVVPGTPALNDIDVHLVGTPSAGPGIDSETVATVKTDADGHFKPRYKPSRSLFYSVTTDQITKTEVEYTDSPPFIDILQPSAASAGRTVVLGKVTIKKVTLDHRKATVRGAVGPKAATGALVKIVGKHGAHKATVLKKVKLSAGDSSYKVTVKLGKGAWKLRAKYSNGENSRAATSAFSRKLTVS
jgi:tungstate transport system substrate-binding protein